MKIDIAGSRLARPASRHAMGRDGFTEDRSGDVGDAEPGHCVSLHRDRAGPPHCRTGAPT